MRLIRPLRPIDTIIDLSYVYRRLSNLQVKSEHYHICLRTYLWRMGYKGETYGTINNKIMRRESFARELGLLVDDIGSSHSKFCVIMRPVVVYWVSEKKLLDVDCSESAKKLLHEADLKSYNEYKYLLKISSIPENVKNIASNHIKILEDQVL